MRATATELPLLNNNRFQTRSNSQLNERRAVRKEQPSVLIQDMPDSKARSLPREWIYAVSRL